MMQSAHEIWAKLDAGTEAYFKRVNRTSIPFARILENITRTAQWAPLWIQSLFLRVENQPPPESEILAYCERINAITATGGGILGLQLYTVARPTPEKWATALSNAELDRIAALIKEKTALPQQMAYGCSSEENQSIE
jgi:wyosine [tRNA(Phe)-imidazoG37] synthetase (radical SAM superfamily)